MTITQPTTTGVEAEPVEPVEPELCWLNLTDLAPHPDNPRTNLGDLGELTRSIRTSGVLESLLVLPADADGQYLIVAGHRRHAAAIKAGNLTDVPAVVRSMTPAEVVEAMLSENVNRADLTIGEEVRAIERLMSLDEGLTPSKLCRRVGKSQAWVRARMAVTILPARWRAALDTGDLSLAAGEAAATVADLGPEHLDAVCEHLAGRGWGDPARTVANYRDDLRRQDAYDKTVDKIRAKHPVVFTTDDPPPSAAKRLGELFDPAGVKAHRAESCHAVVVRRTTWGDGSEVYDVCCEPRRHSPAKVASGKGSGLATDRSRSNGGGGGEDSHAKRQGRLARLAHATETWGKTRGGMSQSDITRVALRGLVAEAGREAIGYAATILGYDQPRDVTSRELLDAADSPAALARTAGAVACGLAETAMYWSSGSQPCRDYLALLTGTGWTPDDWTADALSRHADPEPSGDDFEQDEADDDEDPDPDAEV
jgi:ParB/RepB/Spo0J family partition protein